MLLTITTHYMSNCHFPGKKKQFLIRTTTMAYSKYSKVNLMELKIDSNQEISAYAWSNLCYLTCLRHLIGSRAGTNRTFFLRKDLILFMRAQHVLSYHLV